MIPVSQNRNRRRNAYTLVELVVSVAVSSILMVGLGSSIYIASQANDVNLGPFHNTREGSETVFDLAAELQEAQTFTERTPTSVEFTVADRDGDLSPETIRYAWSGTAGDPLTRQSGGGSVVNVAEDVHAFNLGYRTRSVSSTETQETTTTSSEYLMAYFEGWPEISSPNSGGFAVKDVNWAAQYFNASGIPGDASKVTITRAQLQMKQSLLGALGSFTVGIHLPLQAGSPEPEATPVGTPVSATSSVLDTVFGWKEFTFSDVVLNNPQTEFVLLVKGLGSGLTEYDAEVRRYEDNNAPANGTIALWTTDGGQKWNPRETNRDDYDFLFRVWGTYESTTTEEVTVTRYFLTSTEMSLQVGSDSQTAVRTQVQLWNRPEVSGP